MLAIQLPDDIDNRLEALIQPIGRSKAELVREAILDYLEDLEDYVECEQRLLDIQEGRSRTYTLDEVERELGLAD